MSICLFHVNKNIVKTMIKNSLSHFIKKCSSELELWTYSKFRQIMCLPFLPREDIKDMFDKLENKILDVLAINLSSREIENVVKVLLLLKTRYFHNEEKLNLMCKFEKFNRTTNLVEGAHSGLNKSSMVKRSGNMNSMIHGRF